MGKYWLDFVVDLRVSEVIEADSREQALEIADALCADADFMEGRLLPALRAKTFTADDVELSDVTEGRDTVVPTVDRPYLTHKGASVRPCQGDPGACEAER